MIILLVWCVCWCRCVVVVFVLPHLSLPCCYYTSSITTTLTISFIMSEVCVCVLNTLGFLCLLLSYVYKKNTHTPSAFHLRSYPHIIINSLATTLKIKNTSLFLYQPHGHSRTEHTRIHTYKTSHTCNR